MTTRRTTWRCAKEPKARRCEDSGPALKGWNDKSPPVFGADGDYGEETETWVRSFQSAHDLNASGAIDGVSAAILLEYRKDDIDDSA